MQISTAVRIGCEREAKVSAALAVEGTAARHGCVSCNSNSSDGSRSDRDATKVGQQRHPSRGRPHEGIEHVRRSDGAARQHEIGYIASDSGRQTIYDMRSGNVPLCSPTPSSRPHTICLPLSLPRRALQRWSRSLVLRAICGRSTAWANQRIGRRHECELCSVPKCPAVDGRWTAIRPG